MSSEEYRKKFKKMIIKCKNYLNGCYSKNVNKNRRILYELYRIFKIGEEEVKSKTN